MACMIVVVPDLSKSAVVNPGIETWALDPVSSTLTLHPVILQENIKN